MSRPANPLYSQAVYNAIMQHVSETGAMPTVREISRLANIKSTSTVHKILLRLEREGVLELNPHHSRGIRLKGERTPARVPVLGRVAAGNPILAVEDIEGYIPFTSSGDSEGLFALRVDGFSMKNVGILPNDLVIANRNLAASDGDIVIGMDGDEATVKRLAHDKDGKVVFLPENDDFSPIYPDNPAVLGKVIGCYREY